jgi:hypothetical protein
VFEQSLLWQGPWCNQAMKLKDLNITMPFFVNNFNFSLSHWNLLFWTKIKQFFKKIVKGVGNRQTHKKVCIQNNWKGYTTQRFVFFILKNLDTRWMRHLYFQIFSSGRTCSRASTHKNAKTVSARDTPFVRVHTRKSADWNET